MQYIFKVEDIRKTIEPILEQERIKYEEYKELYEEFEIAKETIEQRLKVDIHELFESCFTSIPATLRNVNTDWRGRYKITETEYRETVVDWTPITKVFPNFCAVRIDNNVVQKTNKAGQYEIHTEVVYDTKDSYNFETPELDKFNVKGIGKIYKENYHYMLPYFMIDSSLYTQYEVKDTRNTVKVTKIFIDELDRALRSLDRTTLEDKTKYKKIKSLYENINSSCEHVIFDSKEINTMKKLGVILPKEVTID